MNQVETVLIGAQPPADDTQPNVIFSIAMICALAGVVFLVAGVYTLFGTGWALLAAAPGPLVFSMMLMRGLQRGGA